MKKKTIKGLDLDVYSKKLDNGLEVYIIPNHDVNNTYATYSTRYRGIHNDFIPYGEKEMYSVPKGIAHFLEHKMFEQEDGKDVFQFFSERGSDANANTNYRKTTYLFSGPNAFYENLEFLLDYVEKPHFTDSNVEKEKGIIIEELEMYEDRPYSRLMNTIMSNAFINHPMKYPVIGTKESIRSITKEDLYKCYNTFYHPSNMYVVVTGNVDPNKVIEVIEEHESKRSLKDREDIKIKEYNEPNKVLKEKETIKMDIAIPKVAIAYKISIEEYKDMNIQELYGYIVNAFDLKVSSTSLFNEKLRNENLIIDMISVNGIIADNHMLVIVSAETRFPDKVIELIINELKELNVEEIDLERRKRSSISNLHYMTDNIYRVNDKIVNDILLSEKIDYDPINSIRSRNIHEVNKILNSLNLDNKTICILEPDKLEV